MLRKILKEVRKMAKECTDVITKKKEAFVEIASDNGCKKLISSLFIGIGVMGLIIRFDLWRDQNE